MIVLAWNCRGLARASTKRSLRAIIKDICLDVIFLSKTKIPTSKARKFLGSMGFYNLDFVDPKGKRGGLIVGWKLGVDMEVTSKSKNLINSLVFSNPVNEPWFLSLVYGPSIYSEKCQFWESISKMGEVFNGAWLCKGDFNQVWSQADKLGGRLVANSSCGGPRSVIEENGLIDMMFSGNPFTWSNKRVGLANIKERLDRAFANDRWRFLFPRAIVYHFPASTSDRSLIILFTEGEQKNLKRPFKFEEAWTRDKSSFCFFFLVVEKAWRKGQQGTPMYKVCRKIKETKEEFKRWNREWFGNIQTRICECWDQLKEFQNAEPTEENLRAEASVCVDLQEWLRREELSWKNKSRNKWLTTTDLNTKYFLLSTIIRRRRRNAIDFLKNQQGRWIIRREEISQWFVDYFINLFSTSNPPRSK